MQSSQKPSVLCIVLCMAGIVMKPYRIEDHGRFMAEAYEVSPDVGQLAVSYVIRHYCNGANGSLLPKVPLDQDDIDAALRLKEDLSLTEEARQFKLNYSTVAVRRRAFYRKAGIPGRISGRLTSVRLAVENDILSVRATGEGSLPEGCSSYDIAMYDLVARGIEMKRVCRLVGGNYQSAVIAVLPRVVSALGLEPHRRALSVLEMYERGIFKKGLIRRLDDFPDTVKMFDQQLGPNHSFRNKT